MMGWAAGRGDRPRHGALCPSASLVPGACVDIIGGAPVRVPVWETALVPRTPAPAASFSHLDKETVMTPRKQKNGRVRSTPEPLRVANPHAAGIDVHAAVHWVAVPPDHAPPRKGADRGD